MKNSPEGREAPPNAHSIKPAYYIVLVAIPVILLLALEGALRLFNFGTDLSLFKKSELYKGYYEINQLAGKRYFSRLSPTGLTNDIFRIKKPTSSYRIFVLGESTTAGFPYQPGLMFSRILQYRLQDAFPNRRIEVVNTGLAAVSSFTHLDFADEIIAQHPDAVLIYSGHNEYYGTLGIASVEYGGNARWMKKLHLKLIRLRTYQLVQRSINVILPFIAGKIYQKATLMERIAQGKTIVYGSKAWQDGIDQYRANMTETIGKFRRAGIRVMLSEEVSNVRDLPPFKSLPSASDPGAGALFDKARAFEAQGRYDSARTYYYMAKDHDAIPFRAPEALNSVVADLGKKFGLPIVPMEAYFEQRSPNGLIGYNLILEHAHPTAEGYFLMADAFFNTMRKEHFIADNWDSTRIRPSEYYRANWGFTALDSLAATIKIKQIVSGWPFKSQTRANSFQDTYFPSSFADSLAYDCIIRETAPVEKAHITLARRAAAAGDNLGAYREYLSLINSFPYGVALYKEAVKYLDAAGAGQKALDLLLSMPNRDESLWIQGAIGTLYRNLHNPAKAVECFRRARELMKPGDTSIYALAGLYLSYSDLGDTANREKIAAQIRACKPGFDFDLLDPKPQDAPKLADRAFEELKKGNTDRAITLLRQSLTLKETFRANFLLGSIYFEKKDLRALRFMEAAYAENPKDPALLTDLVILYYVDKNLNKASKCLSELQQVAHDPGQTAQLAKLLQKGRAEMAQR